MEIITKIDEYLKEGHIPNFFQVYAFTTENIGGYISRFDLKGNTLLTLGSSSDQAINAILHGAQDVTVYDISPLASYFYYLKLASLLTLNRNEFLEFLYPCHDSFFFSRVTFEKVKLSLKLLNPEAYEVWNYLFEKYSREKIFRLFRADLNSSYEIFRCNPYLKNDAVYEKTRMVVFKNYVNFITGNIVNISTRKKFDNVWLSNVADYLKDNEIKKVLKKVPNLLNNHGQALLNYFWTGAPKESYRSNLCCFEGLPCEPFIFDGVLIDGPQNSIYVYRKQ